MDIHYFNEKDVLFLPRSAKPKLIEVSLIIRGDWVSMIHEDISLVSFGRNGSIFKATKDLIL